MSTNIPRPQHLFIVRMWQEADAVTETVQWRGSVKYILSAECHYFTRLPDLLTFIAARTAGVGSSSCAPCDPSGRHDERLH